MALLKLVEEHDTWGLGIYCDLALIPLCYRLNKDLGLRLRRAPQDFYPSKEEGAPFFKTFVFEDRAQDLVWMLIENHSSIGRQTTSAETLFELPSFRHTLVRGRQAYDYFLAVDGEDRGAKTLAQLHRQLPQVKGVKALGPLSAKHLETLNQILLYH